MVSCLMGDSTALASAIVRCCPKTEPKGHGLLSYLDNIVWKPIRQALLCAAPEGASPQQHGAGSVWNFEIGGNAYDDA